MICEQCGNTLESDALFCNACGAKVAQAQTPRHAAPTPTQTPAPKQKRTKAPVIAGISVVLVAILVTVGVFFVNDAKDREAHKTFPLTINLSIENFDPATSTPIPMHIEGVDFEGNSVDINCLTGITADEDMQLMRGNYTIYVAGSPISGEGAIYEYGNCLAAFEVTDENSATITVPELTFIPVDQRTPELVEMACTTLREYGFDENKVADFQTVANNAIEEFAAEQERLAAEAAAEAELCKNDGTYTVRCLYAEYRGAYDRFEGGTGVRMSVNWESDVLTIKSFGGDFGFPAGTYEFPVVKDPHALSTQLGNIYSKKQTSFGPTTDHGRTSAEIWGNDARVTFTIDHGQVISWSIN